MRKARQAVLWLSVLSASCGDDGAGSGSLRVELVAEDTIVNGLSAGSDEEDTLDYGVSYSKFLVVVGHTQISKTSSHDTRTDPNVYVADLRQIGTVGLAMTTFDDLASGQWDQFGYQTPVAASGIESLGGVSDADVQTMIDGQFTYWIEGTVQAPKPVKFVFKVPVGTQYANCESNGDPGVAVSEGGASTAQVTIHGDHLWFNSIVHGDESTVTRRAAWLVLSDTDGDGMVTSDDLKNVKAEQVFPTSEGYNLSGSQYPIATAYDFVRAQLATQGHLNGEGDCVTTPL